MSGPVRAAGGGGACSRWKHFYEPGYEHDWNWGPDFNARYGVGWRAIVAVHAYGTSGRTSQYGGLTPLPTTPMALAAAQ